MATGMRRPSRLLVASLAATCLALPLGTGTGRADPATSRTATQPPLSWKALKEPGSGGRITALDVDATDRNRVLVGGDMLGVGLSTDAGQSWQPTFGLNSYEMAEFTHDPVRPQEVWAGSMSGPQVSSDGGATWTARRSGLPPLSPATYSAPVETVLFDAHDPTRLLAFGGSQRGWPAPGSGGWGAVWESRDHGTTWTRRGTVAGGGNIVAAAFLGGSSSVLVAAVEDQGVWRSADGGATWQRSSSGLPDGAVTDLAVHPTRASELWVSLGASGSGVWWRAGGVYRSHDGGLSWSAASAGLNQVAATSAVLTSQYLQVVVAPSAPDVLYTSDGSADRASVFRSQDGGASWSPVLTSGKRQAQAAGPYASGPTADAIAIDPHDPMRVFIGQSEYLLMTSDGGSTWTDVSSTSVAGQGYVGRGFSGLVATRVRFDPHAAGHLVLLGMDGGNFLQTLDGGASWRRTMGPWDNWQGAYDASYGSSAGVLFVLLGQHGGFNGIAASTDDGATWTVAQGPGSGLPARGTGVAGLPPTAVHAVDDRHVLATVNGTLYRSADGGRTWQVGVSGLGLTDIAADPRNAAQLVVAGAAGVFTSGDGGQTLRLSAGSPGAGTRLAVDAEGHVLVTRTGRDGGLWRQSGGTWTEVLHSDNAYGVAADPSDPNRIALATFDQPYHDVVASTGVWLSTDAGQTFTDQSAGLPVLRASTVGFDPFRPGRLVVGTGGRGFFEAQAAGAGPVDRSGPTLGIDQPSAGATLPGTTVTVGGTTADPSGVAGVEVAVRDSVRNRWLHADGTWGAQAWLPSTLARPDSTSGTWLLQAALGAGSYVVSVRGTDRQGNTAAGATSTAFTVVPVDSQPPSAHVRDVVATRAGVPVGIVGVADDDHGVMSVAVAVRDRRTLQWLRQDGTWGELEWLPAGLDRPAARSTGWHVRKALPAGDYAVVARVVDTAGNPWSNRSAVIFSVLRG